MLPKHPEYNLEQSMWTLWRRAYEGGEIFRTTYLKPYSLREDPNDFVNRSMMSPVPAFAKAAIDEVKNAIYQRISDVSRQGGSQSYADVCKGLNGGVDLNGTTMNTYIGIMILLELLVMRKVGVCVDMPEDVGTTKADSQDIHPYLYQFPAEDILNWQIKRGVLTSIAVNYRSYENDSVYDLPATNTEEERKYTLLDDGVLLEVFNPGEPGKNMGQLKYSKVLDLKRIPIVLFELNHSLMQDIAVYQVALMNMMSADIQYCRQANFPFYTEQSDPADGEHLKKPDDMTPGTEGASGNKKVVVGTLNGRRYAPNMERPAFIHPSSEPLMASMAKQDQMKQDIRQLLALAIGSLQPKMQSAESKSQDNQGLEAGLSYIAMVLQDGERQIASIFADFEGNRGNAATVTYPDRYSLMSETDRQARITQLTKLKTQVASKAYRKAIAKELATLTVGDKVSTNELTKIHNEIDAATVDDTDPNRLRDDVEAGILDPDTAANAAGYPEGTAAKAEEAHTRKLAAIAAAQTPHDAGLGSNTSKDQKTIAEKVDGKSPGRQGTGENK